MMSPGGVLLWTKCIAILEEFIFYKEKSSQELAILIPVKARDPFPRIKKMISLTMNLEAGR